MPPCLRHWRGVVSAIGDPPQLAALRQLLAVKPQA